MINFEAQSLSALEIWSLKFSLFTWEEFNTRNVQKPSRNFWLNTDMSDVTLATEDSGYCNGGPFSEHLCNWGVDMW